MSWLLAVLPFATVHEGPRLLVGTAILAWATTVLGGRRLPPPARPVIWVYLLALLALAWSALAFLPADGALRALLQPGLRAPLMGVLDLVEPGGTRPLAVHPRAALERWLFSAEVVLLALAVAQTAARRARARLLSGTLVSTGVLVVLLAWAHRLGHLDTVYGFTSVPTVAREPVFGPFINPNHGGVACALVLPLALQLLRGSHFTVTLAGGLAAMILAAGTWTCGSRAAPLVALLCLGVYGLMVLPPLARRAILLLATAGAALAATLGLERLVDLYTRTTRPLEPSVLYGSDTFGDRVSFWADTLRMIRSNPVFGTGPGGFIDGFRAYKTSIGFFTVDHAHSDPIQVFAELGIPGGVLWLSVFGAVAVGVGLRLYRRVPATETSLVPAYIAALAGLLAYACIDFPFRIGAFMVLAAVLSGTVLGLMTRHEDPASATLWRWIRAPSLGLAAMCGALTLVALSTRDRPTSWWGSSGRTLDRAHQTWKSGAQGEEEALRLYGLAIAQRPMDPAAMLALTRARMARYDLSGATLGLQAAVRTYPTLPEFQYRLARVLGQTGRPLEAVVAWSALLRLTAPDEDTSQAWVAEALGALPDPVQAAELVIPERPDRMEEAGRTLAASGYPDAAEEWLKRAADAEVRFRWSLYRFYLDNHRLDDLSAFMASLPADCTSERMRGFGYLQMDRPSDALEHFQEALSLCGSGDLQVRIGLGEARLALDDAQGVAILQTILAEAPGEHRARRVLVRHYRKTQDWDALERHLQALVDAGIATSEERRLLEKSRTRSDRGGF